MPHAHRARTAIAAMLDHPEALREPVPSVKAARAALRPLGALSREARRREGAATARELVAIAVRDALADAFHLGRTYALSPQDLEQLHTVRLSGRPFPAGTMDRTAALACYVGNLLRLAEVHGLSESQLHASAEEVYKHEIA
ncbi:hypothetical protein K388_07386 [Streptomyces sp. KhCrAH-43]|uniref:hypothetical protein n=1 Tax=unclassified Streptomyces TaxID=2593676 RepID=UPI000DC4F452|nr:MULTISPECIES: hypothetical protein [unclassified Streptomyces]RAJ44301.1 hypothetical protein K388_07386 [Streptomyces sp. KhCrAH-43]